MIVHSGVQYLYKALIALQGTFSRLPLNVEMDVDDVKTGLGVLLVVRACQDKCKAFLA